MELTIFQATLQIGVFPNWHRWAKHPHIPNMVKKSVLEINSKDEKSYFGVFVALPVVLAVAA